MFDHIKFANPEVLYLLLLIPVAIVWYWFKDSDSRPKFQISSYQAFAAAGKSFRHYFIHLQFVLKVLAFAMLIVALAR
ncbi:MAG: aerotolerance regulator BatA, partial [Bacteroidetes bacterium HGW-Bacteroidetes-11]